MKRIAIIGITLLILLSGVFVLGGESHATTVKANAHAPLRINSDTDFSTLGFPGSGTPGDPYIIENYEIDGTGYGYCIYIGNTSAYFVIRNNYLHNATGGSGGNYYPNAGVSLYNVKNGTIYNNLMTNSSDGIYIWESCHNTIDKNNITNNSNGIYIEHYSNYNNVTNNNISYNSNGGIEIALSNGGNITGNNLTGNYEGIHFYYVTNMSIIGNNASQNDYFGIYVAHGGNNTVENNTVHSNKYGIEIYDSPNNTLYGNNASSNRYGIDIGASNYTEVLNNTIYFSTTDGLYADHSNNCTIVNNTISSSGNYGIYLTSSNNNTIYHNNIINNAHQAYDDTGNNAWNATYPMGGNYWSDYTGSDEYSGPNQDLAGGDGIGDTPYTGIDGGAGAKDSYPLMHPTNYVPEFPQISFFLVVMVMVLSIGVIEIRQRLISKE